MMVEAFSKFQAALTRNEGGRALLHEIIERRAVLTANLQDIGKAFCRNQHSKGTFAF